MRNGIHSISVIFNNSIYYGCAYGFIGIVKADHKILYPCAPGGKLSMTFYNW
jgi:hypothetical protein